MVQGYCCEFVIPLFIWSLKIQKNKITTIKIKIKMKIKIKIKIKMKTKIKIKN